MARTIYALLVAIDDYPAPISPLRGCVNDIQRIKELLGLRIAGAGDHFDPLVLTNREATRLALIDGFRNHLGKAGPDDVVLFYYSGHGSQAPSPSEFWHLEPDHLDETLVCWDSRQPGNWDLADKELAQLISEVAAAGAHVAVILDCCHSGSGTRAVDDPNVRTRRLETDERLRPFETFLVAPGVVAPDPAAAASSLTGAGWFALPKGNHVLFSACRSDEEAKELYLGGEQRGAFSYHLLDTLQRTGETLTYRDLFKRVNALVRTGVAQQSPQIESTHLQDIDLPFLGGAIVAGERYFTASFDKRRNWVIDGGSVHGIAVGAGNEKAQFALFPIETDVAKLGNMRYAIGQAEVQNVFPAQSSIVIDLVNGAQPDPSSTYKTVLVAQPQPPLVVSLEGDEQALQAVRDLLNGANIDGQASSLVRAGDASEAAYRLSAANDRYRIFRVADAYPLVVDTPGYAGASAALVVQRLEHIARWTRIAELDNKSSTIARSAITLEIIRINPDGSEETVDTTTPVRLEYQFLDGAWRQPQFKIRLTNQAKQRLYCMLLDLPETYGVIPLLPGAGVWLDPAEVVWAFDGQPVFASVPEELWKQGVSEFKDTLKLIVSTEEADATLLAQDDLPFTVVRGATRRALRPPVSTLDRLMQRVQTRHFSARPSNSEAVADWTAAEVGFTTVRPLESAAIAKAGQKTTLGHGVTLLGHTQLQARARLSSLPQSSRDLGNLALPSLLRDHSDAVQPFEFTTSRGGEPGLSVLELLDVQDHTVVTPDEPLVVQIENTLRSNESLLPLGYDGEFYLPLGRIERCESGVNVRLDRLPPPTSHGSRDVAGAIKILFQKIVGPHLGFPFIYPQLAAAHMDDDGSVHYNTDTVAVRDLVTQADKIVLYIHGILGDTRSLIGTTRTSWRRLSNAEPDLHDHYDLVLTYDYESINTSIEENARMLKQRLQEVGLGPNHGKTVHIVAHSMGGLVSRWFIEREGGNQGVVQHLVMLGTPNDGSPWPTVQDWAITAITFGLNSFSAVAWPVRALSLLVGAIEGIDIALDQLKPGSSVLQSLANSADPGVGYTIIAGNRGVRTDALQPETDKGTSRFERLWEKVKPKQLLYGVSAAVFFGQPNDIAVSVKSIQSVRTARTPRPLVLDPIGCDHITYFSTEEGLVTLVRSLQ